MKKAVVMVFAILVMLLAMSTFSFADHFPMVNVDVNMENSYNYLEPNSSQGPVVCDYTAGSLFSNKVTGYTWVSVATDMTGSANVYIKGSNGVIQQSYSSNTSGNYVRSGTATVTGCKTAEYVRHYAVRTYYSNGEPTYADDWEYKFY